MPILSTYDFSGDQSSADLYNFLLNSGDPLLEAYGLEMGRTGEIPFEERHRLRPHEFSTPNVYTGSLRGRGGRRPNPQYTNYINAMSGYANEFGEGWNSMPTYLRNAYHQNKREGNIGTAYDGLAALRESNPNLSAADVSWNSTPTESGDPGLQILANDDLRNYNELGTRRMWNQNPTVGTLTGVDNSGLRQLSDNSISNEHFDTANLLDLRYSNQIGPDGKYFGPPGAHIDSAVWKRDPATNTMVRQQEAITDFPIYNEKEGMPDVPDGRRFKGGGDDMSNPGLPFNPNFRNDPNYMAQVDPATIPQGFMPISSTQNNNPAGDQTVMSENAANDGTAIYGDMWNSAPQGGAMPLTQDMDYLTYQHPTQYAYNSADAVAPFLGRDYRGRMMDNMINQDVHTGNMLDLYQQQAAQILPEMYSTDPITQRRQIMDSIATAGNQNAYNNMQADTQGSAQNYMERAGDAGNVRNRGIGAANRMIDQGAENFDSAMTTDANAFANNTESDASNFARDMRSGATDFQSDVNRAGSDAFTQYIGAGDQFNTQVGNIADESLGAQGGLYSNYLEQGGNATDLMNRMSERDYSSELLDRRLEQTQEDTMARMNAMGLGRSGATAEALAQAQADAAMEFANQDWQRDASLASMAGQFGMQGAGAMSGAIDSDANRRMVGEQAFMDSINRATDTRLQTDLMAGQAGYDADIAAAQNRFNTAMAGEQARLQAGQAGAQAGLQADMQQGANLYQGGMANAQDAMTAGRDIYGSDMQNVGRGFQADQALTGQYASNADAYWGDIYQNQQNLGATTLDINRNILGNQINRGQNYYGNMMQFDAETSRANANAMLEDQSRRANLETGSANRTSDIYGNMASTYNSLADNYMNLGGQMMLSGLTAGAGAYTGGGQVGNSMFSGVQGSGGAAMPRFGVNPTAIA